ncbi:MAG: hypothetical protein KatS3mg031_2220 [Chitinophagales bacterium]|nr:MAG: hypothetical protein KatS3mg031_2220 [Chitinophagales bacterium]
MRLIEVTTYEQGEEFIRFPVSLYKGDPNYIRPLDDDIRKVFDPERNKFFKHGTATRWLLKDDSDKTIGRVAAFINESKAYTYEQPTGGMGFFECINDRKSAFMLFDQCKEWLQARGMQAMDGPINFGERNAWWGLLIDGFTEPTYLMNYNPPYYKDLFEAYGFKVYFYQYSYGLGMNEPRPKKYYEKAEKLMQDPNYWFCHLDMKRIEKFTEDFRTIYNKAFGGRAGVKELSQEQATRLMQSMKPVIVDYLFWFGYYKDEPIAIFFMLPELNKLFKYVNGKMDWLGKLKFAYHRWRGTCRKVFGFVFGVVPEHQGKGVEGSIVIAANAVVQPKKRWDDIELTWIADFNPKMMKVAENLGARIVKTHATYRKLFDENAEFKRAPIED